MNDLNFILIMLIFILIQSCEHDHDIVRANAVKLFHCLAEDGDNNIILEHVGQRRIETLLKIIKTSNDGSDCCRQPWVLFLIFLMTHR